MKSKEKVTKVYYNLRYLKQKIFETHTILEEEDFNKDIPAHTTLHR